MEEAKYEQLVKALTDHNVALTDANNEYRSTYDIIKDIAAQWDKMSSMEQAALATELAGTRQQAVFYSMISNFQEASGAMDAMSESAGELSNAYSVYMDTTQAHVNQFKASFQELGSDLFNSEGLKGIVDLAAKLVDLLDLMTEKLGASGTAIALFGTIMSVKGVGELIRQFRILITL